MAKIKINEVMKNNNIKVNDMLPHLPFSRATVYRIINGEKSPNLDELEEFAKYFRVPLEDLYVSEYSGYEWIKNLSQY